MATTTKALFRGAATTNTTTNLYSVPAATTTVVSNIIVSNTAATASTVTLAMDGLNVLPTTSIAANTVAMFDMKQVLSATKAITGGASSTGVVIHISGVEIS